MGVERRQVFVCDACGKEVIRPREGPVPGFRLTGEYDLGDGVTGKVDAYAERAACIQKAIEASIEQQRSEAAAKAGGGDAEQRREGHTG